MRSVRLLLQDVCDAFDYRMLAIRKDACRLPE